MEPEDDNSKPRWDLQRCMTFVAGSCIWGWMAYSDRGIELSALGGFEWAFLFMKYGFAGWLIAGWTTKEMTQILDSLAKILAAWKGK